MSPFLIFCLRRIKWSIAVCERDLILDLFSTSVFVGTGSMLLP